MKNSLKIAVLPIMFAGNVSAATISYYLNQSNDILNGIDYAQVTISDGFDGDIDFSVEVISSAFSVSPDANFGLQTFSFNYDPSIAISSSNIIINDPSQWKISKNANAGGGFGKFDYKLSGKGSSRTEILDFSITGISDDSIFDYAIGSDLKPASGEYFAAHIAGFDQINSVTSAQFAGSSVVPVPAAIWLFTSGLIALSGLARLRK